MRTLVLGLGNPVLSDDGVGWRVVEALEDELAAHPEIDVRKSCRGGIGLMEELLGYDRALIVDAIRSGEAAGTVHLLHPHDLPTRHSASAHDASLATALELGRRAGGRLPTDGDILLVAVEADDVHTFSERCTHAVSAAIPVAALAVKRALSLADDETQIEQEVPTR